MPFLAYNTLCKIAAHNTLLRVRNKLRELPGHSMWLLEYSRSLSVCNTRLLECKTPGHSTRLPECTGGRNSLRPVHNLSSGLRNHIAQKQPKQIEISPKNLLRQSIVHTWPVPFV